MEYETHQQSRDQSSTCGDEKHSQVLGNTSSEKGTSVFRNEKCSEKFEVIPSAIDERRESKSVHKRNNDEISEIRSNQIIEDIELREHLFFIEIPSQQSDEDNKKSLLKEAHTRNPELVSEKYGKDNTPRKDDEEESENTVEHEIIRLMASNYLCMLLYLRILAKSIQYANENRFDPYYLSFQNS